MARADGFRDMLVTIDGQNGPYPAKADPSERWNGFLAQPWFTRETVQRIVDDLREENLTESTFEWRGENGDVLVELLDGEEIDSWGPGPNDLYAVGGYGWCWTEAPKPDAVTLELTEIDLRVLRLAMGNLVEANPDDGEVILLDVRIAEALESLGVKL